MFYRLAASIFYANAHDVFLAQYTHKTCVSPQKLENTNHKRKNNEHFFSFEKLFR